MSDPLRIAVVVEGPTDYVFLGAAVRSLLGEREFEFHLLQPEFSELAGFQGGATALGWAGVYRWCRQTADEGGGRLSGSAVFQNYDLLIVQLDAEVASERYEHGRIVDPVQDLPCDEPCPPASATTNRLRKVMLRWTGEPATPAKCVFCTPSKPTEAWVVPALFPRNRLVAKKGADQWECHLDPEAQLAQVPKARRVAKTRKDYNDKKEEFVLAWPAVRNAFSEAARFSDDLLAQIPAEGVRDAQIRS